MLAYSSDFNECTYIPVYYQICYISFQSIIHCLDDKPEVHSDKDTFGKFTAHSAMTDDFRWF